MNGKAIFLKYWIISEPLINILMQMYHLSLLPGMKEGISGSMISGNNLGIIKNVSEDKKEAVIEVYKFYLGREYQKENFMGRKFVSAVEEYWYDEEICQANNLCDIIKIMQYTQEPHSIKKGRDDYRKRYQNYIYQYLYKGQSIEEMVKKINDIFEVYYVTLDTENSNIGLIWFIISIALSVLMILFLIFPFRENQK